VQNNQHRCLHRGGATECQDEAHCAPHTEADEDQWDEDQLLIRYGGGSDSAVLPMLALADGPVLRERLVLCGDNEDRPELDGPLSMPLSMPVPSQGSHGPQLGNEMYSARSTRTPMSPLH
jgi:hypothetical protein